VNGPAQPYGLYFLVPGDWNLPTGGYTYDRRIVMGLRDAGHFVVVHQLMGAWPHPSEADLAETAQTLAQLPDHSVVVADGLAFGTMASVVAPHARRLRWVALVHHPLHLETGLTPQQRQHLLDHEMRALQHARRVLVTSTSTAVDVIAMGVAPTHVRVVEPGTDHAVLSAPSGHHGGPRRAPLRLLCVATLTPRKGHRVLLQALDGLNNLDWELHNVGSAERDPDTAAQLHAQAAPMAHKVFWHGEVDAASLQAHYASADVFVLASLHEGFGMVVTEALAHGLPVVSSNAGALAHTLPLGAGVQVPAGEVEPLRAALAQVMTDDALRASWASGARQAAAQLPTWSQQVVRFAAALEDLKDLEDLEDLA
jgi:glycosyltransferase involved in cell wall biosynthesis